MENTTDHFGINMTLSNSTEHWEHIVESFNQVYDKFVNKNTKITKKELEETIKHYILDSLSTSQKFGEYFCKKYKIIDYNLLYPLKLTYQEQLDYINNNYVQCKS